MRKRRSGSIETNVGEVEEVGDSVDGASVGCEVVGRSVVVVGTSEMVGTCEMVGKIVGVLEGLFVGISLGAKDGQPDGTLLGTALGVADGVKLGLELGPSLGAELKTTPCPSCSADDILEPCPVI